MTIQVRAETSATPELCCLQALVQHVNRQDMAFRGGYHYLSRRLGLHLIASCRCSSVCRKGHAPTQFRRSTYNFRPPWS
jgi:hypothetical protein